MDVTATRALFKPVEGGYVFRVPYQTGLGKVRHYLVSESQKTTLAETIDGKRPLLMRACLALLGAGTVAVATLVVYALSPHPDPQASDTLAIVALTFVLIAIELAAWRWWKLRQLAPTLAHLAPTDLRITRREMHQAMFSRLSAGQLRASAIICGLAGAMNIASGALSIAGGRSGLAAMISGVIFTAIGVYYALHLLGRKPQTP
jgi:hypothetical protein